MSMDFTEFRRKLGAEPRSEEPDFLAACDATAEHQEAAAQARDLEKKLDLAVEIPPPADLLNTLQAIPGNAARSTRRWPLAMRRVMRGQSLAVGWPRRSSRTCWKESWSRDSWADWR